MLRLLIPARLRFHFDELRGFAEVDELFFDGFEDLDDLVEEQCEIGDLCHGNYRIERRVRRGLGRGAGRSEVRVRWAPGSTPGMGVESGEPAIPAPMGDPASPREFAAPPLEGNGESGAYRRLGFRLRPGDAATGFAMGAPGENRRGGGLQRRKGGLGIELASGADVVSGGLRRGLQGMSDHGRPIATHAGPMASKISAGGRLSEPGSAAA